MRLEESGETHSDVVCSVENIQYPGPLRSAYSTSVELRGCTAFYSLGRDAQSRTSLCNTAFDLRSNRLNAFLPQAFAVVPNGNLKMRFKKQLRGVITEVPCLGLAATEAAFNFGIGHFQ